MAKEYSKITDALAAIDDDAMLQASLPTDSGRPKKLPGPLEGKLWDKKSILDAVRAGEVDAPGLILRPVVNGKVTSNQIRVSLDLSQSSVSVESPGMATAQGIQSLPSGQVPAGSYVQDSVVEALTTAWSGDREKMSAIEEENRELRQQNLDLAVENTKLKCRIEALESAPAPVGPPTLEQNISAAFLPMLVGMVQKKIEGGGL